MKKILIAIVLLFSAAGYSQQKQDFDDVSFLDNLSKKNEASVNDALKLFSLVIEKKQPSVKDDPANNVILKKGYISLMVAKSLNLSDSVFYALFKSERYAFRACAAHNLLNPDGSEYDVMSGEELIEFLNLASEYKAKGAAK